MEKILLSLQDLQTRINHYKISRNHISSASVGWHIAHITIVIGRVVSSLVESDSVNFKSKFSLTKTLVFAINKIPRGKGKAPKASLPDANISLEYLSAGTSIAIEKIKLLEGFEKNKHFAHPYFGNINKRDTIKFLNLHTKHHLKIIDDIISK